MNLDHLITVMSDETMTNLLIDIDRLENKTASEAAAGDPLGVIADIFTGAAHWKSVLERMEP